MVGVSCLSLLASMLFALEVAQVVSAPVASAASLSDGSVTTLAGSGANGTVAGTGTTASFGVPRAIAYSGGAVYVADSDAVAKVITASGVTTVVTTALTGVYALATDGTNLFSVSGNSVSIAQTVISTGVTTSLPALPAAVQSVVLGTDGNLYATAGSSVYKQVPSSGAITTVATLAAGESAFGLATDATNAYVYAYNSSTSTARLAKVVLSSGTVSTLTSDSALPYYPILSELYTMGGYLYVGGQNAYTLRRYSTSTGAAANVAGSGNQAHADGIGAKAWFYGVNDVTGDGTNLFVADADTSGHGNYVRRVAPGTALPDAEPASVATATTLDYGAMTTVAGNGNEATSAGTGTGAGFNYPFGITYLNGALYVGGQDAISKVIPSTGVTTVVAGTVGAGGCPKPGCSERRCLSTMSRT